VAPDVITALGVSIMAMPFMFGVLTLFALLALALSRLPDGRNGK
jgi:hypothetical protein